MHLFVLCFFSILGGSIFTFIFYGDLLSLYYTLQGNPAVPFDQESFLDFLESTMSGHRSMVAESLRTGEPVDQALAAKVSLRLELLSGGIKTLVKDISVYHFLPTESGISIGDPSALDFSPCEKGLCNIQEK